MVAPIIENYEPPPRKSHKRLPGREPNRSAVHFGLNVRGGSRHGLHIDRDTYASINKRSSTHFPKELNPALWDAIDDYYEDEGHRFHTDEWCTAHQSRSLENFDLNMAYCKTLDPTEFETAVAKAVAAQKGMVEVTDLNEWDGKRGLYVMVLDEYKQAYVGVTESDGGVKARIRQHWSNSKAFDRLLWGRVDESIISIDSFRALDTTRIYAAKVRNPLSLENKVIESLPAKYLLNRIMGGDGRLIGLAAALGVDIIKKREFGSTDVGIRP